MKILLVEDETELRSILGRSLARRCGVEIVEAQSGNQGLSILKKSPDIDLVISDYSMPDGTGGDLFKELLAIGSQVPFVLHSSRTPSECPEFKGHEIAGYALKPDSLGRLAGLIEKYRSKTDVFDASSFKLFFPVELEVLIKIGVACCPYYLRLSERKHVKVCNAGDPFDTEDAQRFRARKIKELQIRTEDCAVLVTALAQKALGATITAQGLDTPEGIERLAETITEPEIRKDVQKVATLLKLVKSGELKPEDASTTSVNLHENLRAHLKAMGFSEAVRQQAEVSARLAIEAMGSISALKPLIDKIKSSESGYVSAHSVYTAYLSCAVCMKMPWESWENRHKLALASFLHDILIDNEKLAHIRRLDDHSSMPAATLSYEERQRVRKHPEDTVAYLRKFDTVFANNVEELILHHHERPDGLGFPGTILPEKIGPLLALFIICHDLSDYLLTAGPEASLLSFLVLHRDEYAVGNFKSVVEVLDKMRD